MEKKEIKVAIVGSRTFNSYDDDIMRIPAQVVCGICF